MSRHGAWNVGLNIPEDEVMVTHRLVAAGYRTHNIGKAHLQSMGSPPEKSLESIKGWMQTRKLFNSPYYGFQSVEFALGHTTFGMNGHYGQWILDHVGQEKYDHFLHAKQLSRFYFGGEGYDWNLPTRYHNSVWTAERAIAFLDGQGKQQPFFLAIGFQDPHHPHCLPLDFQDRIGPAKVSLPDFVEGELNDKPPHFLEARHGKLEQSKMRGEFMVAGQGRGGNYAEVNAQEARLGRAYYYGMCKLINQQMGRILDYLDKTGLAENALVIFTTDHGELLGDHGLWMKGPFHYEQLLRVPLIIRWPRGFRGGQRVNELFSHVDLVPTILAATALEQDEKLDGVNGLPLLKGEQTSVRDATLIECVDDPRKLRLKTVVTKHRKLTWYCQQTYGELYDLERDPREKKNLWDDPAYTGEKSALLSKLLETTAPLERRIKRDSYA